MKNESRVVCGALALVGLCGISAAAEPRIVLSDDSVMHDEVIEIAVEDVEPWGRVTLQLTAEMGGKTFASSADYYADVHGRVHVPSQAPVAGSYAGADAMGLFWSMVAEADDDAPDTLFESDPWTLPPPQPYELTALVDGVEVAAAPLQRIRVSEGVEIRKLEEGRLRGIRVSDLRLLEQRFGTLADRLILDP